MKLLRAVFNWFDDPWKILVLACALIALFTFPDWSRADDPGSYDWPLVCPEQRLTNAVVKHKQVENAGDYCQTRLWDAGCTEWRQLPNGAIEFTIVTDARSSARTKWHEGEHARGCIHRVRRAHGWFDYGASFAEELALTEDPSYQRMLATNGVTR